MLARVGLIRVHHFPLPLHALHDVLMLPRFSLYRGLYLPQNDPKRLDEIGAFQQLRNDSWLKRIMPHPPSSFKCRPVVADTQHRKLQPLKYLRNDDDRNLAGSPT